MELYIANLTVLLFIINYFLGFLFKTNGGYLACGLFGYCGAEAPDLDKIKILGLFNQDRGTDSCGIAINDVVTKGVDGNAKFSSFIQKYDFEIPDENFTVVGHTRRATHGIKNATNAHPFEIYKDDNEADPTLIFAHNGVIKNWLDLCKSYGVDTKDINVDSLGLGSIIAKAKENIKVLTEYKGGAALLFYPLATKNCLYLFHGKSKDTKHKAAEEERPLFYWKVKDRKQIYVSSMKESLLAIGGGGEGNEIFEVEHNKLILIQNGEFVKLKPALSNFDRSEVVNTESYYENDNYFHGSAGNVGGHSQGTFPLKDNKKGNKETKETGIHKANDGSFRLLNSETKNNLAIDMEPLNNIYNQKLHGNRVYFHKGRYWRNGHLAGGQNQGLRVTLDLDGIEVGKPGFNLSCASIYNFINGYLCKNEESYNILYDEFNKKAGVPSQCVKVFFIGQVEKSRYDNLFISKHTEAFCHTIGLNYGDAYKNGQMFTGCVTPRFSNKTYYFKDGDFVKWEYISDSKAKFIADGGLLPGLNKESCDTGSCGRDSSAKDIEKEMAQITLYKDEHDIPFAPGVPQESPEDNENLMKEEENLDLFIDAMNSLKENTDLIEGTLEKEDDKSQSFAMAVKLKGAYSYLHEWFVTKHDEDDEEEINEIRDEATALKMITEEKKEKKAVKPLY